MMIAKKNTRNKGFTYVGLLFLITLLAINLVLAGTLYAFVQQREKERQLLFIGNQFRKAISDYYLKSPGTVKHYPLRLEDLLLDNRYVTFQRYLRKIYIDPMTKKREWGLVMSPEGGIMGVYSLSNEKVLKLSNFDITNLDLNNKSKYSEWHFTYLNTEVIKP